MKKAFYTIQQFKYPVMVVATDQEIVGIKICPLLTHGRNRFGKRFNLVRGKNELISAAVRYLKTYFNGNRTDFDLPIDLWWTGNESFYRELRKIRYGELVTYSELADRCAIHPRYAGRLLAANMIQIVIQCHRVVHKDGRLGGYSSGSDVKKTLIELESGENLPSFVRLGRFSEDVIFTRKVRSHPSFRLQHSRAKARLASFLRR